MHTARTALSALVLTVALSACGGGDGTSSDDAGSDDAVRCASFDPDCEEVLAPDTVELRGILFRPAELEVTTGTTVTFSNMDAVDHTVTAGGPDEVAADRFDLTLATAGDTATVTFDEPGRYAYFCRIHPDTMQGVVVVR